ncbi:MAG: hypothetical protein Q8P41_26945 [Pseudomonadota bacterium]|nr:hypothetical protein [Pseudomonadota bacterium]
MSVAALFEGPAAEAIGCEYIPVATEAVFEELWVPACGTLGLRWVPCFQSGIPITSEDLPDVIDELDRLRCWVADHAEVDTRQWWLDRIDRLRSALHRVRDVAEPDVWIG